MAQFVLKIELLSHIMGTTPILEMARAYGLRPRLWLLVIYIGDFPAILENVTPHFSDAGLRLQISVEKTPHFSAYSSNFDHFSAISY